LLVFISFIDTYIACVNTESNWTCPGGYLRVDSALWKTISYQICNIKSSGKARLFNVTTHMKTKCDNTTSCEFRVNDSSFGVLCGAKCSGLDYSYECVSKSLVLPIVLIIFSTI
jgi:hypothetical protein